MLYARLALRPHLFHPGSRHSFLQSFTPSSYGQRYGLLGENGSGKVSKFVSRRELFPNRPSQKLTFFSSLAILLPSPPFSSTLALALVSAHSPLSSSPSLSETFTFLSTSM